MPFDITMRHGGLLESALDLLPNDWSSEPTQWTPCKTLEKILTHTNLAPMIPFY